MAQSRRHDAAPDLCTCMRPAGGRSEACCCWHGERLVYAASTCPATCCVSDEHRCVTTGTQSSSRLPTHRNRRRPPGRSVAATARSARGIASGATADRTKIMVATSMLAAGTLAVRSSAAEGGRRSARQAARLQADVLHRKPPARLQKRQEAGWCHAPAPGSAHAPAGGAPVMSATKAVTRPPRPPCWRYSGCALTRSTAEGAKSQAYRAALGLSSSRGKRELPTPQPACATRRSTQLDAGSSLRG